MKEKIKEFIKKLVFCLLNPKFLFCFGIGWIITNGWSYAMFTLGMYFNVTWMIVVSSAYLAFLWLPISPEKLVTFAIALFLMKWLFPNDEKTLGVMKDLHMTCKRKYAEYLEHRKSNRQSRQDEKTNNKSKKIEKKASTQPIDKNSPDDNDTIH